MGSGLEIKALAVSGCKKGRAKPLLKFDLQSLKRYPLVYEISLT